MHFFVINNEPDNKSSGIQCRDVQLSVSKPNSNVPNRLNTSGLNSLLNLLYQK